MLKVFLDESGIHSGAEVCVVAGYANSARRWKVFEQLWKQRLNKAGLLEFKAARFFRRNSDGSGCGDYHGWKREELIALFNDLVAIINKTKPLLIGSVLAVNDFLQLSKDEREYLTGGRWHSLHLKFESHGAPNRWFHVPMQNVLFIAHYEGLKHEEEVNFVCDEQKQFAPHVVHRFNEIKKNRPELTLGSIEYGKSHLVCALQAADLVAYLCAEYGRAKLTNPPDQQPPLGYEFQQVATRLSRIDWFTRKELLELLDRTFPKNKLRRS